MYEPLEPQIGETLCMKQEPKNIKGKYAVAVLKEDAVVGHVLYNTAPAIGHFLAKDAIKGFAEVLGNRLTEESVIGSVVDSVISIK